MKIGILLPSSVEHPTIAMDFYDGIQSCLKSEEITELELITESIGFGGVENEVKEKLEKMILLNRPKVIIGFLDYKILDKLTDYIEQMNILFIAVNAGANYPLYFEKCSKNIIHLNLQQAFACWVSGQFAAAAFTGNGAFVSTYYDSGYLHSSALANGYLSKHGNLAYNYIDPQHYVNEFDIDLISKVVDVYSIQTLLCIMDKKAAEIFLNQMGKINSYKNLNFVVSPQFLKARYEGRFVLNGFTSWIPELENEKNVYFKNYYNNEFNKQANDFALLGWELGLILQLLLKNAVNKQFLDLSLFNNCLIETPRGNLIFDDVTNHFISNLYQIERKKDDIVINEYQDLEKSWKIFSSIKTEGFVSGWTNTYLNY